jgi:hypothetical protein
MVGQMGAKVNQPTGHQPMGHQPAGLLVSKKRRTKVIIGVRKDTDLGRQFSDHREGRLGVLA